MSTGPVTCPKGRYLPDPIDHTLDLAFCAAMASGNMNVATLIIDFRNVCMTMPLHEDELPFNCCEVKQGLTRYRPPLYYKGEPRVGTFTVWRVLGFGAAPPPCYVPGSRPWQCAQCSAW